MDTKLRSIVKTLSWRLKETLCTFGISLIVIGDTSESSTITLIQIVINTIDFHFHEHVWNIILWGLQNKYRTVRVSLETGLLLATFF